MVTDKQRPIRKTAFMTWKKCKRKFQYFYFAEDEEYFSYGKLSDSKPLRMGTLFHDACEGFFKRIDLKTAGEVVDIQGYFRGFLPQDTEVPNKWYDYFAQVEADRLIEYTAKNWLEHYMPTFIEKKLHLSDTIDRTGHVDRIDYLPDKEAYCIVEYKTGKSYDPTRSRNRTDLRAEIGFYQQILNLTEDVKAPVLYWKLINPTLQIVFEEKIPSQTLRAVQKTYRDIVTAVENDGPFPREISLLCLWCPYLNNCLYSKEEKIFQWD